MKVLVEVLALFLKQLSSLGGRHYKTSIQRSLQKQNEEYKCAGPLIIFRLSYSGGGGAGLLLYASGHWVLQATLGRRSATIEEYKRIGIAAVFWRVLPPLILTPIG